MNCTDVREMMMELLPGAGLQSAPQLQAHVAGCADCAEAWKGLQVTMGLLEEWKAPEISPYFETRFRARLAEAKAEPQGFGAIWRKPFFGMPVWRPVLAGVLAAAAVGIGIYDNPAAPAANTPVSTVSAVDDLQKLDQNQDVYDNLDLLDDVGNGQPDNGAQSSTL